MTDHRPRDIRILDGADASRPDRPSKHLHPRVPGRPLDVLRLPTPLSVPLEECLLGLADGLESGVVDLLQPAVAAQADLESKRSG